MFDELLKKVGGEISGKLAFEELKSVNAIDRWFTFEAFKKSAKHLAGRWKEHGLKEAKVELFPADGKTRVGAWVMPLAWDVEDATLVIEEPAEHAGEVIARYRETPSSLAMWSGPTPKGGVSTELVWVEDAGEKEAYKGRRVKGKIVFTSTRPVFMKGQAARAGAVGVVSDFVPHRSDLVDHNFWMNAFSDDAGGWGVHAGESRIFGFNISPRKGDRLRGLLKKHGRVKVRAVVETRLYAGEIPAVTAVIPGESRKEEVLILGHAFEQGANDNASGCAVMLEAARVLSKLIREGKLAKPKRSIRFLVVSECYTTFAYTLKHRERMGRTVAALCADSVAQRQDLCGSALGIHRPTDSNASFVTAFGEQMAEEVFTAWRPQYHWRMVPYATTDNVITDPMIGPPTVLLSASPQDIYWHTTGDTVDKVDVEALGKIAQFAATYLYAIANAGAVHALYFAALACARAKGELSRSMAEVLECCVNGRVDFECASGRLFYIAERGAREVQSVRSVLSLKESHSISQELAEMSSEIHEAAKRNVGQLGRVLEQCGVGRGAVRVTKKRRALAERAAGVVPKRKHIGTMAYDTVPAQKREGFEDPRWDDGLTAALFWCDGQRTLAEVLELARMELGIDVMGLVETFEFLEKNGLIELRPSGG